MANRSLNKVQLIGNLTRDPELRFTPQGTAVCTFGLATNRSWMTDSGEKKEDVEFHRLVAWNKLAELCAKLLFKGRRVYLEGRLQTRSWTGNDGVQRNTTEIVIDDMILLDSKRFEENPQSTSASSGSVAVPTSASVNPTPVVDETRVNSTKEKSDSSKDDKEKSASDEVDTSDIPF